MKYFQITWVDIHISININDNTSILHTCLTSKRPLNVTSKVNRHTDGHTDRRTDILTYRKHRPRGPMLWKGTFLLISITHFKLLGMGWQKIYWASSQTIYDSRLAHLILKDVTHWHKFSNTNYHYFFQPNWWLMW